jgi:hypothetical protein
MNVNIIDQNIKNIVQYITSNEEDIECENLGIYNELEKIYNIYFLENKREFYTNYIIYKNSRVNNNMPEWMIKRLITLDKLDSLHKYGDIRILRFLNNKLKK